MRINSVKCLRGEDVYAKIRLDLLALIVDENIAAKVWSKVSKV